MKIQIEKPQRKPIHLADIAYGEFFLLTEDLNKHEVVYLKLVAPLHNGRNSNTILGCFQSVKDRGEVLVVSLSDQHRLVTIHTSEEIIPLDQAKDLVFKLRD